MTTPSYIDPATGLRKYGTPPGTSDNPLLNHLPTAAPPATSGNPLLSQLPTVARGYTNPLMGSSMFESNAIKPTGSVATLDPTVEATIEKQIHGKMDNTLKNLVYAHLQVFGTLPDFSLTADILDNGEVEFDTKEEAVSFFKTVAQSYAGTGSEWKLDKSGTVGKDNPILGAAEMRKSNTDGYTAETDVLDPEMIASFRPKTVKDFLLGPYMKHNVSGKESMFRDGSMRLDEMLIAIPKQWALSRLNTSLSREVTRSNPDQNQDEALMIALNKYIAERVPDKDKRPAPTAVWQPQTEAGLRELQMMRASAIYIASSEGGEPKGEQAQQAAAFLQANGYGNILNVLDQQIRTQAMPSGSTPAEQRKAHDAVAAWVEQMWVATRNPGVSQRVALHQLAAMNPNSVTSQTLAMIGHDNMKSHFGMLFGWLGHVPGHEEAKKVWNSNEFKAVRGVIPALVGDISDALDKIPLTAVPTPLNKEGKPIIGGDLTVKDAVHGTLGGYNKAHEYADTTFITLDQSLGDWAKEKNLPYAVWNSSTDIAVSYLQGNPGEYKKQREKEVAYRNAAFAEYLTLHNKQHPDDTERMSSFVDRWKFYWHNNQDARKAGIPMKYTDEIMRRHGINPQLHPEMSFMLGFAEDSLLDAGAAKGLGAAAAAVKATETGASTISGLRTGLGIKSQSDVATHIAEETIVPRVTSEGATKVFRMGDADTDSFVARMSAIYGSHPDDLVALGKNLRNGVLSDGTRATHREIINEALPKLGDALKNPIDPEGWAIHERAKEIMLYDWKSPLYRGKHPLATYMLEKTYNLRRFSIREEEASQTSQRIASELRTTVGKYPGGFEHAAREIRRELMGKNDFRRVRVLDQIIKTGDINKLADFQAGRYLHAQSDAAELEEAIWETNRKLRLNGAISAMNKRKIADEKYVPNVDSINWRATEIRSTLAKQPDVFNQDLGWATEASPSYVKWMSKKKNAQIKQMLEDEVARRNTPRPGFAGNLDENGRPKRYIPLEAERHDWLEVQVPKQDRVPKGIQSQKEVFEQGATDFASTEDRNRNPFSIFDPTQELGFTNAREEVTGIPSKVKRETSKVLRYGDEASQRALNEMHYKSWDEVRKKAGLLTADEMETASKQIEGDLKEQWLVASLAKKNSGASVYDLQRQAHDIVGNYMRERDLALARTRTKAEFEANFSWKHFKDEGMSDGQAKKAYADAREQFVGLAEKQVNAQHDALHTYWNDAFNKVQELDRALPYDLNDEFGGMGIRGSMHQQMGPHGMPRGGAVRMSQETVDLQSAAQRAVAYRRELQARLMASQRQDLGYPATKGQVVAWHTEAVQATNTALANLRDRLSFFSSLETKEAVAQMSDEEANTLRYLMESEPGQEVDLSTAPTTPSRRVFPDSDTWQNDPETAAQKLLDNFDATFAMFGLDPAELNTLRTNLAARLADVAEARFYESRMAAMVDKEMWFKVQHPGLDTSPRIQVFYDKGDPLAPPTFETATGEVMDPRLALSDDALKELEALVASSDPKSREEAIDIITRDMEHRLFHRVENVAERKEFSFVDSGQLTGDGKPLMRETHGHIPIGSTEPLWSPEQIESQVNGYQNIVNTAKVRNKDIQLTGVEESVLPKELGYLADPEFRAAINELTTRIWDAHLRGEPFTFHVWGKEANIDVGGRPAHFDKGGEERLPVFEGRHGAKQLGGKYVLQDVNGKWVVKEVGKAGNRAKNPLVVSSRWDPNSLLANPYAVRRVPSTTIKGPVYQVIDRKARKVVDLPSLNTKVTNISKEEAQKLVETFYRRRLEALDIDEVRKLIKRGNAARAIVVEGDDARVLRSFLDERANGKIVRKMTDEQAERQARIDAEGDVNGDRARAEEMMDSGLGGYGPKPAVMANVIQSLYGEALVGLIRRNIGLGMPTVFNEAGGQELARKVAGFGATKEELAAAAKQAAERAGGPQGPPVNIYWGSKESPHLSNLAPRPFVHDGVRYRSVEHAYQSLKSGTLDEATYKNPRWNKAGGRIRGPEAKLKPAEIDALMETLIRESFEQNPVALKRLLETVGSPLTHKQGRDWADRFPKILMKVRDDLDASEKIRPTGTGIPGGNAQGKLFNRTAPRPPRTELTGEGSMLGSEHEHFYVGNSADEHFWASMDRGRGSSRPPHERPPEDTTSADLNADQEQLLRVDAQEAVPAELLPSDAEVAADKDIFAPDMTPERRAQVAKKPMTDEQQAIYAKMESLHRQLNDPETGIYAQLRRAHANDMTLNRERRMALQRYQDARARLYGGSLPGMSRDAQEALNEQTKYLAEAYRRTGLDASATKEQVRDEMMKQLNVAGDLLDKLLSSPETFHDEFGHLNATLESEASAEWQLHQWHYASYNYSKLSKFMAGGPVKAMEKFNSWKIPGINQSLDDFTTLYKTIVMMKISTMLRIPLADEATRFITEGINPLAAWKKAQWMKDFDKMPDDIKFKVSELIRTASDGTYDWIDYMAKDSFTHYQKMVTAARRDATYAEYLRGRRMLDPAMGEGGRAQMKAEINAFLKEPGNVELKKMVRQYLAAAKNPAFAGQADEMVFKAWYSMGLREGGGLRNTAIQTNRVISYSDEAGTHMDVALQKHPERYYDNQVEGATGGQAVTERAKLRSTEPPTPVQGGMHTVTDPYGGEHRVQLPGVKGDAQGLVDALYRKYSYWYDHPIVGKHWRPVNGWARTSEQEAWDAELKKGRIPTDMMFGKAYDGLFDGKEAKKAWHEIGRLKEGEAFKTWDGRTIVPTADDVKRWRPMLFGQRTFSGTNPTFVHSARDAVYGILDYSGSKMNEMVYAHAFDKQRTTLMDFALRQKVAEFGKDAKLTEDEIRAIEKRAHFSARSYMERVMFTNVSYGGEDFLRNLVMFLPAYRQFATYWASYLAKHPFALSLVYRMNRDQDHLKVNAGGFELDFRRMSFLINQGNPSANGKITPFQELTGWLPNGGPLLTFPVSVMAHTERGNKDNVWGNLAGTWPFNFSSEYSALNSPLDKIFYGAFGKTLPWPFGTDPSKNAWRAIQIQNEALRNHDQRISGKEAMWKVRMNRLLEGGFNFVSPVGVRIVDPDVEAMIAGKQKYNAAKTPKEAATVLNDPKMKIFKTYLKWQNLPSYEQLDFMAKHPEIVPYAVSGYAAGSNPSGAVGLLYSDMAEAGVPDPELYIQRVDEKYRQLNKVLQAEQMRKEESDEAEWWNTYKAEHSDDHSIERLQNEYENSTGAFGPGGNFFIQGKRGLAWYRAAMHQKYAEARDPYIGISNNTGDAYRLAKFMDEMGGAGRALLQMSPNYEMYVLQKAKENQSQVLDMVKNYAKQRMTTRLTRDQIIGAGYTPAEADELSMYVSSIDRLWTAADAQVAQYQGGYTSKEGRAIRNAALEAQNALIHTNALTEKFLGDNIVGLFSSTYLTKPAYARTDYVRLDKMNPVEAKTFMHLTEEVDPKTGAVRLDVPYEPLNAAKLKAQGEVLGYQPKVDATGKTSWYAIIKVGNVIGTIPAKAPAEAKTITMNRKMVQQFITNFIANQPDTPEAVNAWREQLKSMPMPKWASQVAEEDLRAAAWKAWLSAAATARRELRDTPNEYYGGAPGFSTSSKFGESWKKTLTAYGEYFSILSPSFKAEWEQYNANNQMTNAILDWYL